MKKPKASKQATKTARQSSSELAPLSWVDALTKRWERTVKYFEKTGNEFNSLGPKCAAHAVRDCIKELRAEAESASTDTR